MAADVTEPAKRLLALVPSAGLGGGIETYVEGVVDGVRHNGHQVEILALCSPPTPRPSPTSKVRYLAKALRSALDRGPEQPDAVFAFHPLFVPLVAVIDCARRGNGPKPVVVFHGNDIWMLPRWQRWLIRRRSLAMVTVSSFSAGALVGAGVGVPQLLPPALPNYRFEILRSMSRMRPPVDPSAPGLLSVFRLEDSVRKGSLVITQAAESLRTSWPALTVTLAGLGPAPEQLKRLQVGRPWLKVIESPTEEALADLYRTASLFVLATRTSIERRHAFGEGFGIVLIEAQLAGLPVVAPASGGSNDAFIEGSTGRRVSDESPEALAQVIEEMLIDSVTLDTFGTNASRWASSAFDPEIYGRTVERVVFGAR